ncbi:hypothetical protein B4U80_02435 [Leptotrombidium deliense]|uniref:Integrase catalytic domain-containing protein n=1 Tax=Leptotrombidium deliense TaxID=299467 RepID=A0A443SG23_9ACAR|nr:hypothetical protein B4U80_02435 [Leptotrombidium deliense]
MLKQLKIILKLAKINAYDENGRIRDKSGTFIENISRVLLAEKEFIDLLNEANIDPELIINDNVRKNSSIKPIITETIEPSRSETIKRKRDDLDDEYDGPPELERFDEPPPKRTREEADKLEMPTLERADSPIFYKRKKPSPWDKEKILNDLYYNPKYASAFSTAEKLFKSAKLKSPTLTLKEVKEWLSGELTYTLHKPARKNFSRNKIIVQNIDEQWQADLVDLQQFHKQNNDIFSKYAWAIPIKTKTGKNVANAFNEIFKERTPASIQTDKGTEFLNFDVKQIMRKHNINHFTSNNEEIKCAVVERTRRYIDVLSQLIDAYNNTKHRTIKMKPTSVTHENSIEVFRNTYGVSKRRDLFKKTKLLPIGTNVRKQYKLKNFEKGYYPNWSDAIYTITKGQQRQSKPTYKIATEKGDVINKTFYPEELQKKKFYESGNAMVNCNIL